MGQSGFLSIGILLCLAAFPQDITHETTVVNIEVPVRVFDGGAFVDHLTMADFEVYENGRPQEIVAAYLIKKTAVERTIEKPRDNIVPDVSRNFILIFEVREYLKKIDEALEYFFNHVLLPGDTALIVTPLKAYNFVEQALDRLSRRDIVNKLRGLLRNDLIKGGADRRSFYERIETIMKTEGLPDDLKNSMCQEILRKVQTSGYFCESRLLEIAELVKRRPGQKTVFLFYQKEMLTLPASAGLEEEMEFRKGVSFDVKKIKRAWADSSITAHFIFLTNTPNDAGRIERQISYGTSETRTADTSAELFSAFKDIARATGGSTDSSANAAFAFEKAVDASENYYLLYYQPSGLRKDGKFRDIKVKVKNRKYAITHRAGYFAD